MNSGDNYHNEIMQRHGDFMEYHRTVMEKPESVNGRVDSIAIQELASLTGYYVMHVEGDQSVIGPYVCIDTHCTTMFQEGRPTRKRAIVLRYSLDGKTMHCATDFTFENSRLETTDGKISLCFWRNEKRENGILNEFRGTLNGANVSGFTRFNAVELSTFAGNYKVGGSPDALNYGKEVLTLSAEQFPLVKVADPFEPLAGKSLEPVAGYCYNPAMFVLTFLCGTKSYLLMLGSSGKNGLDCTLTNKLTQDKSAVAKGVIVENIISSLPQKSPT